MAEPDHIEGQVRFLRKIHRAIFDSKTLHKVTLHGGIVGWDRRHWVAVEKSATSVTYKHVDEGDEGFPGTVTAFVCLLPCIIWKISRYLCYILLGHSFGG